MAHALRHSFAGLIAAMLAVKVLLKKALLFADDFMTHQVLYAPFEWLLLEVPFSVFEWFGKQFAAVITVDLPPEMLGLLLGYPLIVGGLVAIVERPGGRRVIAYWLGTQLITLFAVAAAVGLIPDPYGSGSYTLRMIQDHYVAEALRAAVLWLGAQLSEQVAAASTADHAAIGIIVASTITAFIYGALWDKHIGHD